MRGFVSVFKREIKGYFTTPLAYVFLVIFLGLCSFLTFQRGFFERQHASMEISFALMPMLFLFLVPGLAMRLWAEERRSGSVELLFTLPITATQAVLGKFFAAWVVLILAIGLTFPMLITVAYLGNPDWGLILTGYIASVLLAGAYLSIGSFFSALTRNQVIAFVLGVVGCGAFLHAGSTQVLETLTRVFPLGFVEAMEQLSLELRFQSFVRGVLQVGDVAFFVVLTAGWLWANVLLVQERRAA